MKFEKVLQGLKQCAVCTECGNEIGDNVECPYSEEEGSCVRALIRDAVEVLKEQEPRVLTLEEVLNGAGAGYLENWFEADDEDPEYKTISECAYCRGDALAYSEEYEYCDHYDKDSVVRNYGIRYGLRIWTGRPTDKQREAIPWGEPPKEGDGE